MISNHYSKRKEFHGMSKTQEYNIWCLMIRRCEKEDSQDYKDYGARGISVCDQWRQSFVKFYNDLGKKPEGYTIDRIDNNGNYEPSNCKWSSRLDQANNQRMKRSNNSGITGVGWSKVFQKWRARIAYNNKDYSLGVYKDFFEACCIRKSAELKVN